MIDTQRVDAEVKRLILDDDVTKKTGIYPYILTGKEKYLSIRAFTESQKLSAYERQGRQAIINDIAHMGIIETSRHSAAATLIPMLEQLGYGEEHITVTYRRHFGLRDIKMLVKE